MTANLTLFKKIYKSTGIAIPSDRYWQYWHSAKRSDLVKLGLLPRCVNGRWIVLLPNREETYAEM